MKRFLLILLALPFVTAAALWLYWQVAPASHDRDWREDHARMPLVERADGGVRISNVRNWSYDEDGTASDPSWIEVTLDPEELVKTWFLVEPFGEMEAIAHTMLGFEFEDGEVYVVSVEARREKGETYQGMKAMVLPLYEYLFVWTTERDMVGNTEFWSEGDLYLYPLTLSPEHGRAVLSAVIRATEEVAEQPRWYNTLFSNCTNVLARAVNRETGGQVPWDWSWYLPGYSDEFLFEEGLLEDAGGYEATVEKAYVTPHVGEVYGVQETAAFSRRLREVMGW